MKRLKENRAILERLTPAGSLPLLPPSFGPSEGRVSHEVSRSGGSTLRLGGEGKGRYLHSRYDPLREARRLAERQEGFVVVLGFGCGYFAAEAARRPEVAGVLALEPLQEVLTTVAKEAHLSHLEQPFEKLRLLRVTEPDRLGQAVAAFYTPTIHERVSLYITDGYEALLDLAPFRDAFQEGVARAAGNYQTMARLGRGWSSNILTNATLLATEAGPGLGLLGPPEKPPRDALLLGAGPGLERWLREEQGPRSQSALVLAADTALPALRARGVTPDLVASIDSQAATYLHYMPGLSPLPKLIMADLTAPPLLTRLGRPVGLFSGGHPLAAYLLAQSSLPRISTEGGNVGYTLLSAAAAFEASRITVIGVDYAYLRGQAYVRGSYLDGYFLARTHRQDPLTNKWSRVLYRDPQAHQIPGEDPWSYRDPRLKRFAESFEAAVQESEARGIRVSRSALPGPEGDGREPPKTDTLAGGAGRESVPTLLSPRGVTERLSALSELLSTPIPELPRPPWSLSPVERALLPLAAWCREHGRRRAAPPFEAARQITLEQFAALGR